MKKLFLALLIALFVLPGCGGNGKQLTIAFSGQQEILPMGTDMTVTATPSQPVDSYQWYLNGSPLPGETEASITIGKALGEGSYRLKVVVKKGNISSSGSLVFSISTMQDAAPVLMSLSFEPASINTSNQSQNVTVTIRATDDLSGVSRLFILLQNPSHTNTVDCELSITSGDKNDGIYNGVLTFPQSSEPGTWTVTYIGVQDNFGNQRYYYYPDLQAAGWVSSIENGS